MKIAAGKSIAGLTELPEKVLKVLKGLKGFNPRSKVCSGFVLAHPRD